MNPLPLRHLLTMCLFAAILLIPYSAVAIGQNAQNAVRIDTAWSAESATPGEQLVLAVVLEIPDGYHIGNSADQIDKDDRGKVMPTEISLKPSGGRSSDLKFGQADFPVGTAESSGKKQSLEANRSKLTGRVIIYLPVDVGPVSGKPLRFAMSLKMQACNGEVCFAPKTVKRELTIPIAKVGSIRAGCEKPELFLRWSDRRSQKLSDRSKDVDYKSKQPPIGPPWVRDLATAQRTALKLGRPIFLYSTKTFCPHCVVVESETLSSPKLKPYYDRAVWLYVYRDFKGGEADRRAERIGIRYSLSSWPQLWLIDPHSLDTIGEVGRTVEAFASATGKIDIKPTDDMRATHALTESEQSVQQFERNPSTPKAIQLLKSNDVVSQLIAARYLTSQKEQEQLTRRAGRLLMIPNDALRYEVLNAISETGKGGVTDLVAGLVSDPAPSRNFNVLRSHAIKALGACGNGDSIETIAPHARGSARNSTTKTAVEAMMRIAERHPQSREAVVESLTQSFPPIDERVARLVATRARQVHENLQKLTGRQVEFPKNYTAETREELVKAWTH